MQSLAMKFYFFLMDTIAFIQWKPLRKWLTGTYVTVVELGNTSNGSWFN